MFQQTEGVGLAVGGGEGEQVCGSWAGGEVEGVFAVACGGEGHLLAAALHVGEPRLCDTPFNFQLSTFNLNIDSLSEGVAVFDKGSCFVGEGNLYVAAVGTMGCIGGRLPKSIVTLPRVGLG